MPHLIGDQPIGSRKRLRQTGLEVFRDTTSILPGQHFDKQIEEALSQYDCMVLLLSNHSMPMRDEVYREWLSIHPVRPEGYSVQTD
jgi:hypothetical protein